MKRLLNQKVMSKLHAMQSFSMPTFTVNLMLGCPIERLTAVHLRNYHVESTSQIRFFFLFMYMHVLASLSQLVQLVNCVYKYFRQSHS